MMQEEEITLRPKKLKSSLYKLHLKENISNNDFDNFKQNLKELINKTNIAETNINNSKIQTEDHVKDFFKSFLEKTYYGNKYFINSKSYNGKNEADLVIHSNNNQNSNVGVIFEMKRLKNKSQMLTYKQGLKPNPKDIFKDAFFQAILYFLWEVIDEQNLEVKNIVISNIYEYFIFDARDIKRIFLDKSSTVSDAFKKWRTNQLTDTKTNTMYTIIENYINSHLKYFDNLRFTYFDIREIQEDDYIYLYKILSPKHLLREVLTNDSNSLNKDFYNELLHIIGLEEVEKDNKKVIQRKEKPDSASLLENTINIIDSKDKLDNVSNLSSFGSNNKEKIYNVSLSLCIRWINRILFLKLLEGQLYKYHGFDSSYKFLDSDKINSFDKLNNLFFSVLAKKTEDRKANIQNDYFRIPYLNSSLFEMSILENEAIDISQLENNLEMSSYKSSVLKDNRGKKLKESLPNLKYLLDFLNSFDFGSEGENKLNNEIKPLINASVLGLIFEKINGYKDGSFYTPGFITTYMCRESIQKAVIQKFNDKYSWNCETTTELYNKIDRIDVKEANEIFNSLKICDPAVGSGHFLVSSLNEIIALKSELGIFCDNEGKKLRGYSIENFNDELVITDEDDNIFEYSVSEHTDLQPVSRKIAKEKTRIQKALFFEKKHIIENSLFGVDINNNSVMICRLRLWIELLKNSFYTEESNFIELETLPNIDINIKQGNSLISRYDLDVNLKTVFNKKGFSVKEYRDKVRDYKETNDKSFKKDILKYIEDIKTQFKTEVAQGFLSKIQSFENELKQMGSTLFGVDKETKKKIAEKQKKLDDMLEQKQEIEKNEIYQDAFEWRFEFPEVLDNDGNFKGFDCVIGNPPYGITLKESEKKLFKEIYSEVHVRIQDSFNYFISKSFKILNNLGIVSLIVPNNLMFQLEYEKTRKLILIDYNLLIVINLGDNIFESASVPCCIFITQKKFLEDYNYKFADLRYFSKYINKPNFNDYLNLYSKNNLLSQDSLVFISDQKYNFLKNKIIKKSIQINEIVSDVSYGIGTGGDKIFRINSDIISLNNLEKKLIYNCLLGSEINRYYIKKTDFKIIYTTKNLEIKEFPNIYNYLAPFETKLSEKRETKKGTLPWWCLHWARKKELFISEKIIMRQTGDKICATYDIDNNFVLDSIMVLKINKDFNFSYKYLLSILNSKLTNYFYINLTQEKGRVFAQVKPQNIRKLYIPKISLEEQKPFIDLVDEILEKKKQNIDTIDLENKIDQMVYQLYELTEEEIAIIEG